MPQAAWLAWQRMRCDAFLQAHYKFVVVVLPVVIYHYFQQ